MSVPLLSRVVRLLADAGIPAALIGAAGMAVHGVSRSTVDQDLLVADARALDDGMWHPLSAIAHVDLRRGDAEDPLAGVVRISATGERDVDVVVGRHAWQRRIVSEASTVATSAGPIAVASARDIVLLKLYAGGPQDLWDVEQLRAATGPTLDEAVENVLDELPPAARDVWRRLTSAP